MNRKQFSDIRRHLQKTQKEMAQLLGASIKAVQSFEQGWRNIPVHTERQILLLFSLKSRSARDDDPCWVVRKCPPEFKQNCPTWEYQAGHLCCFINGNFCQGKIQGNWQKKMKLCRQCRVFQCMMSSLPA